MSVSWEASSLKTSQIMANSDPANTTGRQAVVDEIPGRDGVLIRILDISGAPRPPLLGIRALP